MDVVSDVDDPDWNKEVEDEDSDDDVENVDEVIHGDDTEDGRLLYLMKEKKKIFLGRLVRTGREAVVHHKILTNKERKFEIVNVLDSAHWD